ncbi:Na+/H+ antiporter subunit E [Ornithinimicrobium flavum]|uniref:Na+/H+ antiporter subunit E n=1 Tax=Ornithinimicrobium flavum TaxID=1288636 RepID=UPI00106F17C6|nr:Na+/H+ antiporter subunit E [Ornithinimicrobium flavum]
MNLSSLRRLRVSLGGLAWLAAVWVLLWGSLSWGNVLGGLVFGYLVLAFFPLPRVNFRLRPRPWGVVVLVVRFLYDVVRSSVEVSWLAVRPGRPARGVVMDMELVGDDVLLQTLTAEMVALVPGSVVIDLDSRERVLTIHALGVRTRAEAERVRHRVRGQEARVLRALHPDAAELLHPRRRREAQARLAERDGAGTPATPAATPAEDEEIR